MDRTHQETRHDNGDSFWSAKRGKQNKDLKDKFDKNTRKIKQKIMEILGLKNLDKDKSVSKEDKAEVQKYLDDTCLKALKDKNNDLEKLTALLKDIIVTVLGAGVYTVPPILIYFLRGDFGTQNRVKLGKPSQPLQTLPPPLPAKFGNF